MITPAGSPPWARAASMQSYGGDVNKKDYGGIGSVNARTDVTAAQFVRMTSDLASLNPVAQLFWMQITQAPALIITVNRVRSLWGANTDTPYSGASQAVGFPSVTLPETNQLRVVLPTSAIGQFGDSAAIVALAAFSSTLTLLSGPTASNVFVFSWVNNVGSTAIIRGY
jgi:hypothetical protein